jgi:hypothetical protein
VWRPALFAAASQKNIPRHRLTMASVNGFSALPVSPIGLYDPQNEKDACGVGFIANFKSRPSHDLVKDALTMLARMVRVLMTTRQNLANSTHAGSPRWMRL